MASISSSTAAPKATATKPVADTKKPIVDTKKPTADTKKPAHTSASTQAKDGAAAVTTTPHTKAAPRQADTSGGTSPATPRKADTSGGTAPAVNDPQAQPPAGDGASPAGFTSRLGRLATDPDTGQPMSHTKDIQTYNAAGYIETYAPKVFGQLSAAQDAGHGTILGGAAHLMGVVQAVDQSEAGIDPADIPSTVPGTTLNAHDEVMNTKDPSGQDWASPQDAEEHWAALKSMIDNGGNVNGGGAATDSTPTTDGGGAAEANAPVTVGSSSATDNAAATDGGGGAVGASAPMAGTCSGMAGAMDTVDPVTALGEIATAGFADGIAGDSSKRLSLILQALLKGLADGTQKMTPELLAALQGILAALQASNDPQLQAIGKALESLTTQIATTNKIDPNDFHALEQVVGQLGAAAGNLDPLLAQQMGVDPTTGIAPASAGATNATDGAAALGTTPGGTLELAGGTQAVAGAGAIVAAGTTSGTEAAVPVAAVPAAVDPAAVAPVAVAPKVTKAAPATATKSS